MRRAILSLLLCIALLGIGATTYHLSWQYGLSAARQNAIVHVERYADNLKGRLDRYELLPFLVSRHPVIQDLLLHPTDPARVHSANIYLSDVNQRARISAFYVIDAGGTARAASNWNRPDSFVGAHYEFRPYFQSGLRGMTGRFYGIGTTIGEPGYFVSQPVFLDGQVIGVVAAKINLDWFSKLGADVLAPVVVSDEHGIIFLSSVPAWLYHSLRQLPPAVHQAVTATRQYYSRQITPLPLSLKQRLDDQTELMEETSSPHRRYLAVHRGIGQPDWQVTYYVRLTPVAMNAGLAAFAATCAFSLACALIFYWRQRRLRTAEMKRSRKALEKAYGELEKRVADRTADLHLANTRLQSEVHERIRTESELRAAQSELVQASKLIALGQMAAGITHELNQPLAALRSFSDNTRILLERDDKESVRENLQAIADLTERMGKITGQLRMFAGKARPSGAASANVADAIANSVALLRSRLKTIDVITEFDSHSQEYEVWCDGHRLEQILVNLIGNAAESVQTGGGRTLCIHLSIVADDNTVSVHVRDNGPGIAADALPRLFEPFFTTRQGGLGLGLAISLSIAQEYGGQLHARNTGEGAEFILTLRRTASAHNQHDTIA